MGQRLQMKNLPRQRACLNLAPNEQNASGPLRPKCAAALPAAAPPTSMNSPAQPAGLTESCARRLVGLLLAVFLAISLFGLDGPFLSQHNERQNQTFDTARHVFREGWSAVFTPKASFSLPGYEQRPFTVIRQEFPFHGVLAWPLVVVFGREAAMVRLVSIAFSLGSIILMYLILRQWLAPGGAVTGAAIWTFSPLFLHFGQVPMPDILCTTGMLAAFWFALRSRLPASSACFLFAVLAKLSVAVFGLPILVALLIAKNCQKPRDFVRASICWGLFPLAGLAVWTSLEIMDPDTPWTIAKLSGRGSIWLALSPKFYVFILGCLVPYGIGLLGILGCALTVRNRGGGIHPWLKWSVPVANLLYFVLVVTKIQEPQYLLPSLAWAVMAAAVGLNGFTSNSGGRWRWALACLAGLQLLTSACFAAELKASRIPGFEAFPQVAAMIPPGARVIVAYEHYGASPAVWLDRNVLAVHEVATLDGEWPQLQKEGYTHVLLMDVKSHYGGFSGNDLRRWFAAFFHARREASTGRDASLTDFAGPSSPFRQYCDPKFPKVFASDYLVLYQLPVQDAH